jgi:uncharacterized protein YceK
MRNFLTFAVLLVSLDGCAGLAKLTAQPKGLQAGSYDCTPADRSGTRRLTIAVAPDRNGRDLDLNFDARRQFILSPLAGAFGQLYSGPQYAWRTGSDMSVLTDVENIQTYNCRPLDDGKAVALPGSRALP